MTIDDLLDYDIDALVERTKSRAIPRGAISVKRAWMFFYVQVIIGIYCAQAYLRPSAQVRVRCVHTIPESFAVSMSPPLSTRYISSIRRARLDPCEAHILTLTSTPSIQRWTNLAPIPLVFLL
jgi:hypothetical protein